MHSSSLGVCACKSTHVLNAKVLQKRLLLAVYTSEVAPRKFGLCLCFVALPMNDSSNGATESRRDLRLIDSVHSYGKQFCSDSGQGSCSVLQSLSKQGDRSGGALAVGSETRLLH